MNNYLILGLILFAYMNVWFIVSLIKKRNDVADIAWGWGFVVLAWASFFLSKTVSWQSVLVNILITIWGFRLALHIYARHRGRQEDYRYLEWRKQWGKWFFVRSYFQVFILQGVFLFLIALPAIFLNLHSTFSWVFGIIGLLIWLVGFFFEAVGDYQLSRFIGNPDNKGKIMQGGLWHYTRHPNYFGEVAQWWGIFIIALCAAGSFVTIIGPLTISILILFVSGIPLLEKKYIGNADFENYKKRTSVFFPWFVKK
ncbi:MAG: DUF1295 domain-containing protein [Candidatus Magasanikbacteria bacterium]|nr:DUF1295 domain-containing protein [Candidatus Magasanikbacteria bacterium]